MKTTIITAITTFVLFAIIGTLLLAESVKASICCLVPCVPETPECLPECRYFAGRTKCDSHGDCNKCAMDDTLKVEALGETAEVEE